MDYVYPKIRDLVLNTAENYGRRLAQEDAILLGDAALADISAEEMQEFEASLNNVTILYMSRNHPTHKIADRIHDVMYKTRVGYFAVEDYAGPAQHIYCWNDKGSVSFLVRHRDIRETMQRLESLGFKEKI